MSRSGAGLRRNKKTTTHALPIGSFTVVISVLRQLCLKGSEPFR